MVARIAENGRLHVGHAILYLKICVLECPFNEPLHRKCNLFLWYVQVVIAQYFQLLYIVLSLILHVRNGLGGRSIARLYRRNTLHLDMPPKYCGAPRA